VKVLCQLDGDLMQHYWFIFCRTLHSQYETRGDLLAERHEIHCLRDRWGAIDQRNNGHIIMSIDLAVTRILIQ